LLAKSPADRYRSAREVAELLEQCLAHLQHPTAVLLPDAVRVPASRARRTKLGHALALALGTTLVLFAVLGVVVYSFWDSSGGVVASDPSPTEVPMVSQAPSQEAAAETELLPWNDQVTQELSELDQETMRLEADSDSLLASPSFEVHKE
jgi:hypothetical protein